MKMQLRLPGKNKLPFLRLLAMEWGDHKDMLDIFVKQDAKPIDVLVKK